MKFCFSVTVQGFTVQKLISPWNQWLRKKARSAKLLTLNPEPYNQTDLVSDTRPTPQYIKVYGHLYKVNDEVCLFC
jgi:hypothetical protein